MEREYFYLGRNNPIRFVPQVGRRGAMRDMTPEELAGFTRWELKYLGVYYASDAYPGLFDALAYAADSEVQVDLGVIPGLAAGEDEVEIIGYHDAFPNGRPIGVLSLVVSDELLPTEPGA